MPLSLPTLAHVTLFSDVRSPSPPTLLVLRAALQLHFLSSSRPLPPSVRNAPAAAARASRWAARGGPRLADAYLGGPILGPGHRGALAPGQRAAGGCVYSARDGRRAAGCGVASTVQDSTRDGRRAAGCGVASTRALAAAAPTSSGVGPAARLAHCLTPSAGRCGCEPGYSRVLHG